MLILNIWALLHEDKNFSQREWMKDSAFSVSSGTDKGSTAEQRPYQLSLLSEGEGLAADTLFLQGNEVTPLASSDLFPTSAVPYKTKKPKITLEEDDYIEAASKIIKRDFFPDLMKMEGQYDYLKAIERNDMKGIQAALEKLDRIDREFKRALYIYRTFYATFFVSRWAQF